MPLEDEVLFSQEDLGINFGSFSMFKFLVSDEDSDLPEKLKRKGRRLIN